MGNAVLYCRPGVYVLLCIIVWGILVKLTKLWLTVIDLMFSSTSDDRVVGEGLIVHILLLFYVLSDWLDTLIFWNMI